MQRYNIAPEAQSWLNELKRRRRQRLPGVYLCAAVAALMLAGYCNSIRLMHGKGFAQVTGTIVALGPGSGGEPTMTSEIRLPDGSLHRATEATSYHYARGEPRIGESIDYIYRPSPDGTGDVQLWVRGDGILKWMFGSAAAILGGVGLGMLWLVLREHAQRRELVRTGERVALEMPSIANRHVALPGGAAGTLEFDLWRLQGRVFDARAGEYVDVASDWQQPPAPQGIDAALLPPLLVEKGKSGRRWLPVGALWRPRQR